MQDSDPPFLPVGTEVSAKYKGAFCEAKIKKVVRVVKCKITFKSGLGSVMLSDDQIKGTLRVGGNVEARHPDKNAYIEAIVNKIQDCSQYTVVFDDGDITTLRRSALCLKSGRHFNESETLDQLPLTHPEHFSNPVVGGRRNVRRRRDPLSGELQEGYESSDEEGASTSKKGKKRFNQDDSDVDIGKVVCVEVTDKKKGKDNWFPGLIVSPLAQETVKIRTKDEYLVRSFRDGRYYTVPKKEITSFSKDSHAGKNDSNSNILRTAIDKAVQYIDKDELPQHWDKGMLFSNIDEPADEVEDPAEASDSEDSEEDSIGEEKDRFVAQLYKYMDERGTPINKVPIVCNRDLDLYKLYKIVIGRGGYNKVTNSSQWKSVTVKMGFGVMPSTSTINLVKQGYKKFIHNFEEFYRKLGCSFPAGSSSTSSRSNRTIFRDRHASNSKELKKEEPKAVPKEVEIEEEQANIVLANEEAGAVEILPEISAEEIEKKSEEADDLPRRSRSRQDSRKVKEDEALDKEKSTGKKRRNMKEKEDKEPAAAVAALPTIPTPPPPPTTPPLAAGLAKRGSGRGKYKRKTEKDEVPEPVVEPEEYPPDREFIGKEVQVQMGDKLSVYYGKESEGKKYEAKVVDIKEKQQLYFVHYAGWNTRYDEWIPRHRVAENLSLRTEQVTSVPQGRGPQPSVSDSAASNSDSGSTIKGSASSKGVRKKLKIAAESMSTTRSKSAGLTPRKRLLSEGDVSPSKRKMQKTGTLSGAVSEGDSSEEVEDTTKSTKRGKKSKKSVEASCGEGSNWSKSIPSPDISDFSKDTKDKLPDQVIDLNEIRSEMKGIEKMVMLKVLPITLHLHDPPNSSIEPKKSDVYDFEEENNQTPAKVAALSKQAEKKEEEVSKQNSEAEPAVKQIEAPQEAQGLVLVLVPGTNLPVLKETAPISSIDSSINSVVEAKDTKATPISTSSSALLTQAVSISTPKSQTTRIPSIEPKIRPIAAQAPPPLLIRGIAPAGMIPILHTPIRTTTPIAISIPARSQRPILIQSTNSPTVLPITTMAPVMSSITQSSPHIFPLVKNSVMEGMVSKPELITSTQHSLTSASTPTVTLITTTGRDTGKIQSKIQVRPKLIEGPKLSSYPTARIKSGTGVLSVRSPIGIPPPSLPHPPSQTMNLALKKKRKVKSQKFIESSGSSDEGPERKKQRRQALTSKPHLKKFNQPVSSSTLTPVVTAVNPVSLSTLGAAQSTSAGTSLTTPLPKKIPVPKVTPIVKLKLGGEVKPLTTPGGKILSKKYTRVEQPLKFAKKFAGSPTPGKSTVASASVSRPQQQHPTVIVKADQKTPILLQHCTPARVGAEHPEARSIINPPSTTSATTIDTLAHGNPPNSKQEEPLVSLKAFEASKGDSIGTSKFSDTALQTDFSNSNIPAASSSSMDRKLPSKDVSLTANEEESCHSLLCEEEIPGSPTPGMESKSFSFDDKLVESSPVKMEFPVKLAESLINPSVFAPNQPSKLPEKIPPPQAPVPFSIPERILPDVKEFAMFAEAKPLPLFYSGQEKQEGSDGVGPNAKEIRRAGMVDHREVSIIKYPHDIDDQVESSPRPMSTSASASSGSQRGVDADGEGELKESGSGDNSKSKEASDTDSIECFQKTEVEDMGDENSSSDDGGGPRRKYGEQGSKMGSRGRSRSPSSSPRKRRMVRKGSPDESRIYRGNRTSSGRRLGLDAEYGRMPPPHPPVNLGKPPKCERLNVVIPELTDDMTQDERVETLQGILETLKENYKELKVTIAGLDRKKKRIRKRDREKQKREKEALQAATSDP